MNDQIDFYSVGWRQRKIFSGLSLEQKCTLSEEVLSEVFGNFDSSKVGVAWTGGKDSTLLLWLVKKIIEKKGLSWPKILFVDEGDVFDEIREFCRTLSRKWRFGYETAHNFDVSRQAKNLGDLVKVADLNDQNQQEVKRLGYKKKTFAYEPESLVGNHLMKTVATNNWLVKNGVEVLVTGVRWDEQEARSKDDFFRRFSDPAHLRVEPILHFLERDVWKLIRNKKIPYTDLYKKGYRSLGAKSTTTKKSNKPAWVQDLENTSEREGRQQDKEKIMKRLRALGYM